MPAEAQRLSLLRTMGIDVFRLRATGAPATPASVAGPVGVAVICARDAVPERFRQQLRRALGVVEERAQWCEIGVSVPAAAAYVVIGTEAARALGVQLSTMQQNTSVIAATAEPAMLLRGAAAKRALWQSLKPVARRLRELA